MNVFIVGGGEIGASIAESLHQEHNVVVMDESSDRAAVFETLDVQFMKGNGTDPEDLRAAGIDRADAFVACTRNDDVNVLACLAAKGSGAGRTCAFVTRGRYIEAFKGPGADRSIARAIDRVLWPQRTLAKQIIDIIRVPRAVDS